MPRDHNESFLIYTFIIIYVSLTVIEVDPNVGDVRKIVDTVCFL